MRIARFAIGDKVAYGVVEGDAGDPSSTLTLMTSHPFAPVELTNAVVPLDQVRLLAPVLPSKICAFGRTYADHARELGNEVATEPLMFLKPSTSVIGPGDAITLPALSNEVHYEAELAVVIGRLCKDVPLERADDVILGYTAANDVTARDLQRSDGQWSRAKGFDSFCPLGPWIETDLKANDVAVQCVVDGVTKQDGRTGQMSFSVAELVVWASSAMTLLPGDVILTGTPAGVGPLSAGSTVEVTVEGIGTLSNRVVAAA